MIAPRALALALVAGVALCGAGAARAQDPTVSVGVRQVGAADFEGATRTLERALAGDGLSRADVGRALAALAVADFALRDVARMRDHVAALAVVEPAYRFGPEIPPEIRDAFDATVATTQLPTLRVEADAAHRVSAALDGTRRGLRELVLECSDDHGFSASDRGDSPSVAARPGVRCAARAVWVGGAIVARGSAIVPGHAGAPGSPAPAAAAEPPWLWIGVAIGAAVVLAIIVAVAVASSSSSDPSAFDVSRPIVMW